MRYRCGKFYADWRDKDGVRFRKAFPTQREAKKYQQERRDEVRAEKKVPGDGRVTNFTLAWMQYHTHPNDVAAGKKMIAVAGSMALRELNGAVSQIIVQDWKRTCQSPHTLYNYRYALRRLLKNLIANGAPQECIVELPSVDEPEHRHITLNDEEKFRLLEICQPPKFEMWFRCWILSGLLLGLRRSEARRIAPIHYDPVSQRFYGLKVKNNKRHGMRVPAVLREIFESVVVTIDGEEKYQTPGMASRHVFFDNAETPYVEILNGAPLKSNRFVSVWRKFKKAAQIRDQVVFHDLRRTGASFIAEQARANGYEGLLAAKEFLHHKSLGNTEAYLAFTKPKELDRVLEDFASPAKMLQFPPVAKKRSGSK
jgi:integrase